jgi:hypothetical protein
MNPKHYIAIPQGLARLLHAPMRLTNSIHKPNDDLVWILSNVVDDMHVGERTLKLLTPTPVSPVSFQVSVPQYVPVQQNRFSVIELQVVSNLDNMAEYDGSNDIMVTLHFKPRYKRKHTVETTRTDYKRFAIANG